MPTTVRNPNLHELPLADVAAAGEWAGCAGVGQSCFLKGPCFPFGHSWFRSTSVH